MTLFVLASCQRVTTEPSAITKITSTTSFGMCVGYCKTTLEITETEAVLIREAYGRGAGADLPLQRLTTPLSAQEWQDIAAAATAAAAAFDTLPERIGCPDCADGGAESLTLLGPGRDKSVTFDFGASIAGVQPLLEQVRALRLRLTPSEDR
ncbi:hypothetical protein [Luteitalea sp.]|uniref:hypothetical protein n=1 Tax=Luteitalea sp. TaxID=2004800 RepID=UPI0025C4FAE4|nr:hypothetical protein [Luteitalea sp.]